MFKSAQQQDEFAANMLEFKKNGTYVDIGSADSENCNNSYFFESLDWKGICIESDSKYNNTYDKRNCVYLNADALKVDYKSLFEENNMPNEIDYLSLDIDSASYTALTLLPLDEYKFKVITIEHDFYLHEGVHRDKQRAYLISKGYEMICEDVLVEQSRNNPPKTTVEPFEDWWIYPGLLNDELVNKIRGSKEYPSDIIAKFKN